MVSDLKTFAHKGCHIAAAIFFVYRFFLFHLLTLFKRLFAPTSQSPMSKLLNIQNPWEKVMQKVVSDCKTIAHKGCKIATQKKFAFQLILPY